MATSMTIKCPPLGADKCHIQVSFLTPAEKDAKSTSGTTYVCGSIDNKYVFMSRGCFMCIHMSFLIIIFYGDS